MTIVLVYTHLTAIAILIESVFSQKWGMDFLECHFGLLRVSRGFGTVPTFGRRCIRTLLSNRFLLVPRGTDPVFLVDCRLSWPIAHCSDDFSLFVLLFFSGV